MNQVLLITGGSAITVQADVADEARVLAMFEKVDAKGAVDVVTLGLAREVAAEASYATGSIPDLTGGR